MILLIDGSDNKFMHFALIDGKKIKQKKYAVRSGQHAKTLNFLADFLKRNKIDADKLKKIVVNIGPGSFSGIRVSVTIAQALAFAWDVPIKTVKTTIDKLK